jgi:hypothetical protein
MSPIGILQRQTAICLPNTEIYPTNSGYQDVWKAEFDATLDKSHEKSGACRSAQPDSQGAQSRGGTGRCLTAHQMP